MDPSDVFTRDYLLGMTLPRITSRLVQLLVLPNRLFEFEGVPRLDLDRVDLGQHLGCVLSVVISLHHHPW